MRSFAASRWFEIDGPVFRSPLTSPPNPCPAGLEHACGRKIRLQEELMQILLRGFPLFLPAGSTRVEED
jgi:hypothetical protein